MTTIEDFIRRQIDNDGEHAQVVRDLATAASRRAILDLHRSEVESYSPIAFCGYCAGLCHSYSGLGCDSPDAPYPCQTVRLLALPYSNCEGYDETWLPDGVGGAYTILGPDPSDTPPTSQTE